MTRDRYLSKHFGRFWALLLSIFAHVGVLGLALGSSMFAGNKMMSSLQGTTAIVMASLYVPDSAAQTGQSVITNSGEMGKSANVAIAKSAESKRVVAEPADDSVDPIEKIAQKTSQVIDAPSAAEPVDAVYLQAGELTKAPSVLLDIPPDLSLLSPNGFPQLAILRLLVNERGDIDQVLVENSLLPEQEQNLLKDAFSKTKFQPGEINSIPVKSQLRIEVMLDDAVSAK